MYESRETQVARDIQELIGIWEHQLIDKIRKLEDVEENAMRLNMWSRITGLFKQPRVTRGTTRKAQLNI